MCRDVLEKVPFICSWCFSFSSLSILYITQEVKGPGAGITAAAILAMVVFYVYRLYCHLHFFVALFIDQFLACTNSLFSRILFLCKVLKKYSHVGSFLYLTFCGWQL
jgi:hypothetical protein